MRHYNTNHPLATSSVSKFGEVSLIAKQSFKFCQMLTKFCQMLTKFCQMLTNLHFFSNWAKFWTFFDSYYDSFFKKWAISGLFFFIFVFSIQLIVNTWIKVCWWLDSNRGTLVSEETALPTEPQPLPQFLLFLLGKFSWSEKTK